MKWSTWMPNEPQWIRIMFKAAVKKLLTQLILLLQCFIYLVVNVFVILWLGAAGSCSHVKPSKVCSHARRPNRLRTGARRLRGSLSRFLFPSVCLQQVQTSHVGIKDSHIHSFILGRGFSCDEEKQCHAYFSVKLCICKHTLSSSKWF